MRWIAIAGIALANNLDNAGVGMAFGIARIRLSPLVNLWIALLTFAMTALAAAAGDHLASLLALPIAHTLSALLLCAMGVWMLLPSLQPQREHPVACDQTEPPSLGRILADPTRADRNQSRDIDVREATVLAIALSLNNLGGGFSAGLMHLSAFWTALCSALVSFLALWGGDRAGRQIGVTRLGQYAPAIAGILLVVIGISQFL